MQRFPGWDPLGPLRAALHDAAQLLQALHEVCLAPRSRVTRRVGASVRKQAELSKYSVAVTSACNECQLGPFSSLVRRNTGGFSSAVSLRGGPRLRVAFKLAPVWVGTSTKECSEKGISHCDKTRLCPPSRTDAMTLAPSRGSWSKSAHEDAPLDSSMMLSHLVCRQVLAW